MQTTNMYYIIMNNMYSYIDPNNGQDKKLHKVIFAILLSIIILVAGLWYFVYRNYYESVKYSVALLPNSFTNAIDISGCRTVPEFPRVVRGTIVRFINNDTRNHSLLFERDPDLINVIRVPARGYIDVNMRFATVGGKVFKCDGKLAHTLNVYIDKPEVK